TPRHHVQGVEALVAREARPHGDTAHRKLSRLSGPSGLRVRGHRVERGADQDRVIDLLRDAQALRSGPGGLFEVSGAGHPYRGVAQPEWNVADGDEKG